MGGVADVRLLNKLRLHSVTNLYNVISKEDHILKTLFKL